MSFLYWLIRGEIFLAAAAGLTFVVIYHRRWRWWRSPMGRLIMSFMGGLESIILLTVLAIFWPHMPGRVWISIFAWSIVAFLFAWQTIALVRVKKNRPMTAVEIDIEIARLQRAKADLDHLEQP